LEGSIYLLKLTKNSINKKQKLRVRDKPIFIKINPGNKGINFLFFKNDLIIIQVFSYFRKCNITFPMNGLKQNIKNLI